MSRLEAEVSTLGTEQSDQPGGRRAIRAVSLRLHEVGAAGEVDQVRLQPWRATQEVGDLIQLVEDIPRLAPTIWPLEGFVVAVEHVVVARLAEDDLELLAGSLEDLSKFHRSRVRHMDLVANTPQERLIYQRSRLQVRAEHDHRLEGCPHRHSRTSQGQVIDPPLQGNDQAVEQGARRGVLPAEVVQKEDPAVGLQLDRRLVV